MNGLKLPCQANQVVFIPTFAVLKFLWHRPSMSINNVHRHELVKFEISRLKALKKLIRRSVSHI
jgi:hypothetical protein